MLLPARYRRCLVGARCGYNPLHASTVLQFVVITRHEFDPRSFWRDMHITLIHNDAGYTRGSPLYVQNMEVQVCGAST